MSYLHALLISEARRAGRGVRAATARHRHLADNPLALALWQLGAEPFSVAALAWGRGPEELTLAVPGEPRNRTLTFEALLPAARALNDYLEREAAPQVVVANQATLAHLGRLGRRLAFLSTTGALPADPALIRLGRHLRFLADHAQLPGQQLVLVLTDLLNDHWACELSAAEAQHLGALDAAIEPPEGLSALDAVCAGEHKPVGPLPLDEDRRVAPLMTALNAERRAPAPDPARLKALHARIEDHYRDLITRGAWPLIWRCLARERPLPPALGVSRRWERDLEALAGHRDWMTKTGGIRRLRQTSSQAARQLRSWEEAQRLLVAEEAVGDPMKMIPHILKGDALVGEVVAVDANHRERGDKNLVRRPLVTLLLNAERHMPAGRELYWTGTHDKKHYTLLPPDPSRPQHATLRLETGSKLPLPAVGERATFSVHTTAPSGYQLTLPPDAPWTHEPPAAHSAPLDDPSDPQSYQDHLDSGDEP
ncbi:MAG: hypothetical protein FJ138_12830 [Deltaproteobacteria bacterium]|nr:hypothetical protein [Deltaproteobacteria bacterium]